MTSWWKRLSPGDLVLFQPFPPESNVSIQVGHMIELLEHDASVIVSLKSETEKLAVSVKNVLMHFPPSICGPTSGEKLELRDVLRGLWGLLSFGRVSRAACRASDCNIWWNPTEGAQDRKYLGDNRDVLRRYTKEQVDKFVSIEYDYYYGFAGAFSDKQRDSHSVPLLYKTRGGQENGGKCRDRIVEQDAEDLGIDNLAEAPVDHAKDDNGKDDSDDETIDEEETSKQESRGGVDFHESSFHFASCNYGKPHLFHLVEQGVGGVGEAEMDLVRRNTYSVIPPKLGSLVCGVTTPTKRGATLSSWWSCSESFFELWKLVMSTKSYANQTNCYDELRRLRWRKGDGEFSRFYQELALIALFGKPPEKPEATTVKFIRQVMKMAESLLTESTSEK